MKHQKFLDDCISVRGEKAQLITCIEEMSELTKELCKYLKATELGWKSDAQKAKIIANIQEETADALINIEQMANIFGRDEVERIKEQKIQQCQTILDEEKLKKTKGDTNA